MKKLEKDLYIKHAKRLQAILDEKSTFVPFLNRKDFVAVLKTQLNVLYACEKLFPKVELAAKYSAKSLVKDFNKLTKENFKLDEKYKYEDETDLIDSINYLFTFCNNMFRVNLDDLVEGKKVTATDPHIDLRAKAHFDDEGPKVSPNFAFAGGIPLAGTPYENPYFIGQAYAKLNDDVRQGKFYRYKTKPAIVPIMKKISIILMIMLQVCLLAAAIFTFVATGLQAHEPVSGTTGELNFIFNGVFYIICAAFGIYPLILTIGSMTGKKGKNPNSKYYFAWPFVLVFVLLGVLFTVMDCISVWISNLDFPDTASYHYTAYLGFKYILIVASGICGLNLIPVIVGAVCNPKPDAEAVEAKIREYIDLFSAESGFRSVPPRADKQTPVDVKESKKDSKHKKDDTKKK